MRALSVLRLAFASLVVSIAGCTAPAVPDLSYFRMPPVAIASAASPYSSAV